MIARPVRVTSRFREKTLDVESEDRKITSDAIKEAQRKKQVFMTFSLSRLYVEIDSEICHFVVNEILC